MSFTFEMDIGKGVLCHWHLQLHTRLAERYRWRCADWHSDATTLSWMHSGLQQINKGVLGRCKYLTMNDWTNKWMNEWTNERTNEQTNEWILVCCMHVLHHYNHNYARLNSIHTETTKSKTIATNKKIHHVQNKHIYLHAKIPLKHIKNMGYLVILLIHSVLQNVFLIHLVILLIH